MKYDELSPKEKAKVLADVEMATLKAVQSQVFGAKPLDLKKIANKILKENGNDTRSEKGS
jgi:hypothetical protein